jgi:hypothetical protein
LNSTDSEVSNSSDGQSSRESENETGLSAAIAIVSSLPLLSVSTQTLSGQVDLPAVNSQE